MLQIWDQWDSFIDSEVDEVLGGCAFSVYFVKSDFSQKEVIFKHCSCDGKGLFCSRETYIVVSLICCFSYLSEDVRGGRVG